MIVYGDNEAYPSVNITNGCTNNCVFCNLQKQVKKYKEKSWFYLEKEPSFEEVWNEVQKIDFSKVKEFWIAGAGEPTLRLDDIVLPLLRKLEVRTSMITNGHANMIYPDRNVAKELKQAGLHDIEISLNAENPEKYVKLCRPRLNYSPEEIYLKIVEFACDCKNNGIYTRLTLVTCISPELVDGKFMPDVDEFEKITEELEITTKKRVFA